MTLILSHNPKNTNQSSNLYVCEWMRYGLFLVCFLFFQQNIIGAVQLEGGFSNSGVDVYNIANNKKYISYKPPCSKHFYSSEIERLYSLSSCTKDRQAKLFKESLTASSTNTKSAMSMVNGDTIRVGSIIIDMGISPQTEENGLKPYGLIFDLVRNHKVPVLWIINPDKSSNKNNGFDDVDFSYNGQDFKGGPFIIEEKYLIGSVTNTISQWEAKGVETVTIATDITVPIKLVIDGVPNWTLDNQNGTKVLPGLNGAEIPEFNGPGNTNPNYFFKGPAEMTCCDFLYIMPHSDPDWDSHSTLASWVLAKSAGGCRGWMYSACHAVSALENSFNDVTPDVTQQMNFLSNKSGDADINNSPWAENSLVLWGDHKDGNLPYLYDNSSLTDPFMQFIGNYDNALENGSEQIFMPYSNTSWRGTTTIAVYDSLHVDIQPGEIGAPRAAKLAYGPAYGVGSYDDYTQDNGWIMYMGGHEIKGVEENKVAAYRSFFNFSFMAALSRGGDINYTSPPPAQIEQGTSVNLSAFAVNGSPPYTFTWDINPPLGSFTGTPATVEEGVVVNATFTAPAISVPTNTLLTLTVADQCGIESMVTSVVVISPDPLECSTTVVQDPPCFGYSEGIATVSATGGTPPYTFDWGTADPNALIAGTYTVTVYDYGKSLTCDVTINEPPLLTCSITKIKDVNCYGDNDGQASVSASGGVAPYGFDWGGENPLALSMGTYVVTVTDDNGCTSSCSVTINEPPLLICNITKIQDVSCIGGTDGQASVSASGGVTPYSFDWGGENPLALSMGTYVVTVTDDNGCTSTCSVTINEPPLLICNITKIQDVSCIGGTDGQASVSATGGVTPYSFDWGGENPLSLSMGTYVVTVTDDNGCTNTCSVPIDEPPLLTCSITKIQDVSCFGDTDGQASVSASGGFGSYSFNWGGENPLALSIGSYVVTVTDDNGCTSTCSVSINEPPLLTCSIIKIKDVNCYGDNDGQASVSASGGVAPYGFDWGGENPLALSMGTYVVTVTDDNGCTSSCSVTINEPSLLICNITKIQDVSCIGGTDGQASVSASGGVTPYSFDWGGENPLALSMGTYVVTVTDDNGCTSTCSVTINEPPLLTCSITKIQDVSCFGGTDGQASVSATGGVVPYGFDWGGENPLALSMGTYVVTVTDDNGCTSTCSLTINEPLLLICSITKIQEVSCIGGTDGQASISASGGVTPYSFDWGGENPLALSKGTYVVTVTDDNGCMNTCSVTINEPPLLICNITNIQDVSCFDGNDGQASVSASGGVAPYGFDWGGENPLALSMGTYVVTVTDDNSCTSTCSVSINEPPILTCSITKIQDVSCFGGTDGQASVSASGGVSLYGFDWGGENPLALSMGTYVVTVTDDNGCTSTCSVTLNEPPLLTCSITKIQDVSCFGGTDGQASIGASGGVAPYGFDWGGENPLALSMGTYVVTVTDGNNCTSTCSVTINEPPPLDCAMAMIQDVSCFGGNDGQASISAWGGTFPYDYDWGGMNAYALRTGISEVTVTDNNECTCISSVMINEPLLLTCSITKLQDVSCFGGTDGQASVSASGGVAPYGFDWGAENSMALSVGSYVVTVTDDNGCMSTCGVSIDEPPLLTCNITKIQDVSCFNGTDGQVSVSASGGVTPYNYDWGGENALALSVGSYVVTVTDDNSCTSTCSVTINEPSLLTCNITKIQDVSCYGGIDGQASASASGGSLPYNFDWGGEDPLVLSIGTYVVTVTDGNNCTSTCSVTINEPPSMTCSIVKIQDVSCNGDNDGQASVSATGGISPYDFDWGGEDSQTLSSGTYIVTVTDANNCISTCNVTINEPPSIACSIVKLQDVSCFGGNDGQASVSASGGVSPYDFDWGGETPLALNSGLYVVTVTDDNGCTSTCSVTVSEPSLLTCNIELVQEISCYGGSDGRAEVNPQGGVEPYQVDWGPVDADALSAGIYQVTVTDANNCLSYCSIEVDQYEPLECDLISLNHVDCYGYNTGSIQLSAIGGKAPYQIDWGGVNPSALSSGTYEPTITDQNGCLITCRMIIDEPDELICSTIITEESCVPNDGTITVFVEGGVSPFSYSIDGGNSYQSQSLFEGLSHGDYEVIIMDANACTVICNTELLPDCYDLSLTINLMSIGNFVPGTHLSYSLRVENQGTLPATNIEIEDNFENGLVYLSNNANDNANISEITNTRYRIGLLLPGQEVILQLNFVIDIDYEGETLMNKAQIVLDDGDDYDSDPNTDDTIDEDGDGNGDDDDESEILVEVYNRMEIGDYVWLDKNGNGIQELNESGIKDIDVWLYNSRDLLVQKVKTNENGYYLFSDVIPSTYYLKFIYPDAYKPTLSNRGNLDSEDSDLDNTNGPKTTKKYNIKTNNYTIDVGLIKCTTISGTIWYDYNENDIEDSAENGINGMKVELYKFENNDWVYWDVIYSGLKPGTPSDDGYYEFCVDPGRYYIKFKNAPAALVSVIPFAGNEQNSSKVTGRNGQGTTEVIEVLSSEEYNYINAGYYPMGSIGDFIWLDSNDNGIKDSNEPGVSNITIRAINSEGEIVSQVESDSEGHYIVDYLEKDDYYLEVDLPYGMQFTEANVGTDELLDSDVDGSNGEGTTQMMSIFPGTHLPDVNIGVLESILPVEWISFIGRQQTNKNYLEWTVGDEINVSHYMVEKSLTGEFNFDEIGQVDYRETLEYPKVYNFSDYNIGSAEVNFYRIKQEDFNGSFNYSKIISIQSETFAFDNLQIGMFPNPAQDRVMLKFDHYTNIENGEVLFLNGAGEVVKKEFIKNEIISPDRPLSFDISDLPEGIYSWVLLIDDFSAVDRIVIIK